MAAGEFVSMRAQTELLERELELERKELARHPTRERRELARIYERRGLDAQAADQMAGHMMRSTLRGSRPGVDAWDPGIRRRSFP